MIIVKKENVYGIDIFRFTTSQKIPYQLTFEKDLSKNRINIHLANLFANEPEFYDKEIRKIVCDIIHEYLDYTNVTLFFEIEVTHSRNDITMIKFLRWSALYPENHFKYEITQIDDIYYAEVYITRKNK